MSGHGEFRPAPLEVRGRRISGVAVPWGQRAVVRTPRGDIVDETFVAGAFRDLRPVPLILEHRGPVIGEVTPAATDRGLEVEGDYSGDLAGRDRFSVEFRAHGETRSEGLRIVHDASLVRLAAVKAGAYPDAVIEARRSLAMSGSMFMGQNVDCRCGPGDCEFALVEEVEVTASDLLGYLGDYSKPLGRATARVDDNRLLTEIAVATGVSYADDLIAMIRSGVSPVIRPYPDPMKSVTRKQGDVLVYERLAVAGLIATFTDQATGYERATLAERPEEGRGLVRVEPPSALEAILERSGGRVRQWL